MKCPTQGCITIILFFILYTNLTYAQFKSLDIHRCDPDGKREMIFKVNEIENYVLENFGTEDGSFIEQIFISTSKGNIYSIDFPSSNPSLSLICTTEKSALTDIAINSNQEIFVCGGSLYYLEDDCDLFYFNYSFWQNNALSFDDLDNLYIGIANDSYVQRMQIAPDLTIQNSTIWHDFEVGSSGGDFVLLNNKMYIAWMLSNNNYRLYEVTVDENRNYISHVDLGQLPPRTYGLASELGKLYGVTTDKLFEIDLTNFTFKDIFQNPNPTDQWYGAAGLHEAITYNLSTYPTQTDAENKTNQINSDTDVLISGQQSLYVKIENSLTGDYELIKVNFVISNYPNVNQPENLIMCFDTDFNTFNLDDVSDKMQVDVNDDLSFTFYPIDPAINSSIAPLPLQYTSISLTQTLYVSVIDNNTGCESVFNFDIFNKKNPKVLPLSNNEAPTLLESCYFDNNDNGFFDLDEIKAHLILEDNHYETLFYLSLSDAENNINSIEPIFYLEQEIQEIFVRVINDFGCYTISNFYLSMDCINNNVSLSNIKFPKFFTPNNDGFNDTWNVYGISKRIKAESTITIFDRYGKLLISFKPSETEGWDGTYRGKPLPPSDYWYNFKTPTGQEKMGHFTLKK